MSAETIDAAADLGSDLVALLHRSALPEELALRLARAEALADDDPRRCGLIETVRMAMAVRNRIELLEQRERGMVAVVDSARDLSSCLDLTKLLRAIVTRSRNLLGAPLGWLTVFDPQGGDFRVVVSDGAIFPSTTTMTAARNHGVVSVVMATRLPFSTADYLHDQRFVHDPALDDTFRDEGVAALVGVPMIADDDVVGLLFVADRYHRTHTALNITILSAIATHAAVAINNAKAFEAANAALQRADRAHAELERHAANVQRVAQAHEQLTSLLATGASLGALCQSIAQLLEGSVLVIDEIGQVVSRAVSGGYCGTAADRYAPHDSHSADIARALSMSRQGGRSFIAFTTATELCRVIAVIGGNDVLGAVLLFRHDDLGEVSVRTFERSAVTIGIALLSQERIEASRNRDVSSLIRALVSPTQEDLALNRDRIARFGLDPLQPLSLILVESEHPKPGFLARRLRALAPFSAALFDDLDGALVIVCGTTGARDIAQAFVDLARREFGAGYRGVLSRPVHELTAVAGLYATLRRATRVLARIGIHGQIVSQDEMALYSVLFETHDRTSLNAFLDGTIGALVAHDRKRGSELVATLLSYFDSNQNAKATAKKLGIHVNTVRQRLANVEELLGHWGSPTRALEIHVALRLWSLTPPQERTPDGS